MNELSIAINLQMVIFLMFACGFFLRKRNIITPERRKGLSDLMITLVLPANIIASFLSQGGTDVLLASLSVLGVATLVQAISYLIGLVAYCGVAVQRRNVLRYATIVSNAGFMGNPIMQGLYGAQGAMYASIYLLPLRVVMWTAGLACFTQTSTRAAFGKLIRHPCIIATGIGFVLMLFPIALPPFVTKTITEFSSCLLTISMLIIGGILAEVDLRAIFKASTFYFAAIRLLVIPLITLGVCLLLNIDPMVTSVSTMLAGMPAGSTTAILAEAYGCDSQYAAECVFVTTLASLVTIPIMLMLAR